MTIEDKLKKKKLAVDRELEQLLKKDETQLSQAMWYAVFSGGKRYRPLLALSSGESFGVRQEKLMPFACATELIHNYSLIHDDLPCMDNDEMRRGQPTCHRAFGEDVALLAGDALLTLAFEIMARAPLEGELRPRRERAIQEVGFRAGIQGMIGGQHLDITLSPDVLSEAQLEELILKKTGALIIASVKIGAILGGASSGQLELLTSFGRNVGLAFQTRDDIIDSCEDQETSSPARPNSVSLFGGTEAKRRLERFVEEAIQALDKISVESDALRYLACGLLDVTKEKNNESTA
jgi:geranylgeranyl diphosphate synthase type II